MSETITVEMIDELKANGYIVSTGLLSGSAWYALPNQRPTINAPSFASAARAAWEHYQQSKRPRHKYWSSNPDSATCKNCGLGLMAHEDQTFCPEPKRPAKQSVYTIDTFPTGEVWVRAKGTNTRYLVTGVEEDAILYGGVIRQFSYLANGQHGDTYELSLDGGRTWKPARPE